MYVATLFKGLVYKSRSRFFQQYNCHSVLSNFIFNKKSTPSTIMLISRIFWNTIFFIFCSYYTTRYICPSKYILLVDTSKKCFRSLINLILGSFWKLPTVVFNNPFYFSTRNRLLLFDFSSPFTYRIKHKKLKILQSNFKRINLNYNFSYLFQCSHSNDLVSVPWNETIY